MSSVIRTRIVRVRSSRGIRIPKVVLERLDIGPDVEVAVQSDRLVIRAARRPREGWAKRFAIADQRDDRMRKETSDPWDVREWKW